MKKIILLFSIILLCIIVFVPTQSFTKREASASKGEHLKDLLLTIPEGWTATKTPLGPTEASSNQVERILNYDDVFYYRFTKGDLTFSLYACYWGEGKMPAQLVASHTPDRCWTENGMTCIDTEFNVVKTVLNSELLPAQSRIFTTNQNDQEIYVYFWHLIDGELYDYGERFNAVPHPLKWVRDAVSDAILGTKEQYFIRIDSNRPITQFWEDRSVQEIVSNLKKIGL